MFLISKINFVGLQWSIVFYHFQIILVQSRISLFSWRSQRFSPMFFQKDFSFSIVKSIVNFELIFLYRKNKVKFHPFKGKYLIVVALFFLLKYTLPIEIPWHHYRKTLTKYECVYFWILSSILLIYMSFLLPTPLYLDWPNFIGLKTGHISLQLDFSTSNTYLGSYFRFSELLYTCYN